MKARVIESTCIGCGACQALVPDEFEINDLGIAVATGEEVKEENKEAVIDAKENCPVGAIFVDEE
jgi:ferredoxin